MKKNKLIVPTIYLVLVFSFAIMLYFGKKMTNLENKNNEEITFVSGYTLGGSVPVINTEENITLPYNDPSIVIARYFYDKDSSLEDMSKSVVFYDNVYMPNTGVDYSSTNKFDVLSIYSGTVIDIKEDDIMGKSVEIRHNNEIISVYQGLSAIDVKKGDIIGFGMKIGSSGTNKINEKFGNSLHLEIFKNGEFINPLKCFGKKIGDI